MAGNLSRFVVERGHAGGSLHWEPVDADFQLELAVPVEWLQRAQFAVDARSLLRTLDPYINARGRLGCNHIRTRSTLDHARVYRQASPQIVQLGDHRDLVRKFQNRAVPIARVESAMRCNALQ